MPPRPRLGAPRRLCGGDRVWEMTIEFSAWNIENHACVTPWPWERSVRPPWLCIIEKSAASQVCNTPQCQTRCQRLNGRSKDRTKQSFTDLEASFRASDAPSSIGSSFQGRTNLVIIATHRWCGRRACCPLVPTSPRMSVEVAWPVRGLAQLPIPSVPKSHISQRVERQHVQRSPPETTLTAAPCPAYRPAYKLIDSYVMTA